ncbi:hypothetical protein DEO72_LG2g5479 [Vigna unguiculata]|uniref:Uncharacterized protein n=1 Tax=Vigna unguiculata TaxID=3917 RepID=A0A4D6KRU6_VIGUN|nr:hypothetical protein DEO72_LG2g1099 [Vigna unguiculata]QCD85120.1 hypothetical protein DEO72_LG2g5479 [Vigna unguiculata]
MASAQCVKPNATVEATQPKCPHKQNNTATTGVSQQKCPHKSNNTASEVNQQKCPLKTNNVVAGEACQPKPNNTAIEVCQPKSQHSSFGQKLSEITSKAFKGHHGRHGSNQNQLQCYSQTQVESQGHNGTKTETHHYGQTQIQQDKKHGVSKTQITVTMVQAQITHTDEDFYPYGTTTCFGAPAKKNGELSNNKKDMNLFRRIKNGMSRYNNTEGGKNSGSSSSSDSESDDEKCNKCPKTKVTMCT